MSKLIFKPINIVDIHDNLEVKMPQKYKKFHKKEVKKENQEEEITKATTYKGPSIKELQEEVKNVKENAQNEANLIILKAKDEAKIIIEEAKKKSFEIYQESSNKIKNQEDILQEKEKKIEEMYQIELKKIEVEAEVKEKKMEAEIYEKSFEKGKKEGYEAGKKEMERLISRLDLIVSRAVDIKNELVENSEKEIINVILMAIRKIVKDEINTRKEVVINNIKESFKYLKDNEKIDIRVNLNDLETVSEQKEYFLNKLDSLKYIDVYEDSRVDQGGVIIDTKFGTIDARISTQLKEIENAIRDTKSI